MVNVAWAVAVADPRRAEQIARDIGGGFGTTEALAEIAKVIAVTDPCRVSRRGESHPPPLSGPDVTVSRHPAPTVQP